MTFAIPRVWVLEKSRDGVAWGDGRETVTAHIRSHMEMGDWLLWSIEETQYEMVITLKHFDFENEWRRFRTRRW